MTAIEQTPAVRALVGLREVAEHFEVTPRGIQKWVNRGEFPKPMRVGRRLLRWDVEVLNQWIEAGCPKITE